MTVEPDLSAIANLIGDPTRASILCALMGGEALPASELAYRAHVTPQTISSHVAKLMAGNLIKVEKIGRHRYYSLSSHQVAQTLEILQLIAPLTKQATPRASQISPALCQARTCYDHIAGKLGVAITDSLTAHKFLVKDDDVYHLSRQGAEWLKLWEIDEIVLRQQRRKFAYPCMDWSERRCHVAGALGAAIANLFFERGWLERQVNTRALTITSKGETVLHEDFGIVLSNIT